ncbi:MAG TPA: hypothetical protein VF328_21560, partial [Mycobacterium sp.]
PFHRPDDVGTESTAIVGTFTLVETTTANPELLQTQVASLLAANLPIARPDRGVSQLTLIRLNGYDTAGTIANC